MKSEYFFRHYVVLPQGNIMNNKILVNDVHLVVELMSWFNKRWHSPQRAEVSNSREKEEVPIARS